MIALRDSDTAFNSSGSTTIDLPTPSLTQDNDQLINIIGTDENRTHDALTGWNSTTANLNNGSGCSGRIYDRVASSEPTDNTFTKSGDISVGVSIALKDANGIDVVSTANTGSGTVATCPDITTSEDNCMVLRIVIADKNNAPQGTITDYTMIENLGASSGVGISAQYIIQESQGATGTETVTLPINDEWIALTISVKSAESGKAKLVNSHPLNQLANGGLVS
jgi:hypothetical protein